MKKYIFLSTILTLGLISCNKNQKEPLLPENTYMPSAPVCHVNIPAFLGNDTKAVTLGEDDKLVNTFSLDDNIWVFNLTGGYEARDDQSKPTLLHPDNAGKTANLIGSLQFCRTEWDEQAYEYVTVTTPPAVGDSLLLMYNTDNGLCSYLQQSGTLEGLSQYAFAIDTVCVKESTYDADGIYTLTTSNAHFQNTQSMFKFMFVTPDGLESFTLPEGVGINEFIIHSAGNKLWQEYGRETAKYGDIRILPDNGAFNGSVLYAALRFDTLDNKNSEDEIFFTVTDTDGETYCASKISPPGGFTNSKYYNSEIRLSNPNPPVYDDITVFTINNPTIYYSGSTIGRKYIYNDVLQTETERINWMNDDSITIFSDEVKDNIKTADYAIDAATVSNTGTYSSAGIIPVRGNGLHWGDGTHRLYALFPTGSITRPGSSVEMECDVPGLQTGVIDRHYTYMYAMQTVSKGDNINLEFHPMFTTFEFTVTANVEIELTNVKLTSTTGNLSGPFTTIFRGSTDAPKYSNPNNSSYKWMDVNLSGLDSRKVSKEKSLTFTVLAPPNDIEGLTLELELADDWGTRVISLNNPDKTDIHFTGGMKHKITGIEIPDLWEDMVAINDETETYQPFRHKPYIDFTSDTDTGFSTGEYVGEPIEFPITSYNINLPLLIDIDSNEEHIETFKEAIDEGKELYFYIRYYVEANQYYYWLQVELLGPNQFHPEIEYLIKREINFNPATDCRIKYEIKVPITEQMVDRMRNENGTTYHEGLLHIRGGNITIEGAYITIED